MSQRKAIDLSITTMKSTFKKSDFTEIPSCEVCCSEPVVYEADEKYCDGKRLIGKNCYKVLDN